MSDVDIDGSPMDDQPVPASPPQTTSSPAFSRYIPSASNASATETQSAQRPPVPDISAAHAHPYTTSLAAQSSTSASAAPAPAAATEDPMPVAGRETIPGHWPDSGNADRATSAAAARSSSAPGLASQSLGSTSKSPSGGGDQALPDATKGKERENQKEGKSKARYDIPGNGLQKKPTGLQSRSGATGLPTSRLNKIIKADKEGMTWSKEATFLVGVVTECFVDRITKDAEAFAMVAKSKTIRYNDLAEAVDGIYEWDFLRPLIPHTIKLSEALKKRSKRDAKARGEDDDDDDPAANGNGKENGKGRGEDDEDDDLDGEDVQVGDDGDEEMGE